MDSYGFGIRNWYIIIGWVYNIFRFGILIGDIKIIRWIK